nr:MAG TPA: Protein gp18.1, prophage tail protein gp18.7A [Caudoviricetes sp.]
MEFIICNVEKKEIGKLPDSASFDFDVGDTNDVEITCEKGLLDFGMYLICPGTEYGAIIEERDSWTNEAEEKWTGNAFRRFLQEFIIEPPAGQDYRVVKGDAHDVMRQVLNGAFDNLFTIPETASGIDVGTYQFDRYTDALSGFAKMLKRKGARINIEVKQGGSNEPFSVVLSAVPIQNMSSEIEYSQDSKIAINLKESRRGINHLICLGKGELKDRQVVHLYTQLDGSIRQDRKYYTGLLERTAVYELSYAEDLNELVKNGTEHLKELMGTKTMNMSVKDTDMQIGDIIAGRDYETGLYLQKPVVQKIVRMESGTATIEYKVEGEE